MLPKLDRCSLDRLILRSVEIIRKPRLQFVENVVAGGGVDTVLAKRHRSLANVAGGELGADEGSEVVRLDAYEAGHLCVPTHHPPDRTRIQWSIGGQGTCCTPSAGFEAGEDTCAYCGPGHQPGVNQVLGL